MMMSDVEQNNEEGKDTTDTESTEENKNDGSEAEVSEPIPQSLSEHEGIPELEAVEGSQVPTAAAPVQSNQQMQQLMQLAQLAQSFAPLVQAFGGGSHDPIADAISMQIQNSVNGSITEAIGKSIRISFDPHAFNSAMSQSKESPKERGPYSKYEDNL